MAADLWRGVYAQYVVLDRSTGQRAGLVGLYNVAVDAGRAYAFALAEPRLSPLVTEGFGLLCRWGFDHQCFQRIYIETPEFNLSQFGSLGNAAVVEGRLRNYELWRGQLWDYFILVLTAESFASGFSELLQRRCDAPARLAVGESEYAALVRELWPLDSLGLVEALDALEHVVGHAVDAADLTSIRADTPEDWSSRSIAAVTNLAAQNT